MGGAADTTPVSAHAGADDHNRGAALTAAGVAHFDTFGFVVRKALFSPSEVSDIVADFEGMMDADRAGEEFRGDKRHSVIACVERTERLRALIDDPRVTRPLEQLFGDDLMWWASDGNYYVGDTAWHPDGTDVNIDLRRMKVALYLDPVTASTGCIRFIPGSHRLPLHDSLYALRLERTKQTIEEGRVGDDRLDEFRARGLDVESDVPPFGVSEQELPGFPVASKPGDVVFFDQNLYHASFGGRSGRRMFTMCYCTVPRSHDAIALMRESYEGGRRAVTALSYRGDAADGWPGLHHPEVVNSRRPGLRRLIAPLEALGFL